MLTGFLRIVVPACCASGDGFTLFNRGLAAAIGVDMEAVLAGRQRLQVWRKLQAFRGFADFNATDSLTDALAGDKIDIDAFTGRLRACARGQGKYGENTSLHNTSLMALSLLSVGHCGDDGVYGTS